MRSACVMSNEHLLTVIRNSRLKCPVADPGFGEGGEGARNFFRDLSTGAQ